MNRGVTRAAAAAVATCLGYLLFLGFRRDYVGHMMAGFGATLIFLILPFAFGKKPVGWSAVGAALALILFGVFTEATVFKLAIFDPVDFNNQNLGACMAALCLAGEKGSEESGVQIGFLGMLLIMGGFILAYS